MLTDNGQLTLTVISEHSLATLKKMVGFSGIYFIANNGLEILGPDLSVIHAEAKRARQANHSVFQALIKKLSNLPNVSLNDRGLSLAVNFAKAKPAVQKQVRQLVEEVWTPIMDAFTLLSPNDELILRPRVGWNKSRAVMFLWNKFASPRRRPLVLYLGADSSEEDIFGFMGREGMGIVIGGEERISQSKAGYFLKNRLEVDKFIAWLSHNLSHAPSRNSVG